MEKSITTIIMNYSDLIDQGREMKAIPYMTQTVIIAGDMSDGG